MVDDDDDLIGPGDIDDVMPLMRTRMMMMWRLASHFFFKNNARCVKLLGTSQIMLPHAALL